MLNHVNTVLIGTNTPATYTTVDALAIGDIALFNETRTIVKTAAEAETAKELYIGVCEGKVAVTDQKGVTTQKNEIRYSMPIKKGSKPRMVLSPYAAPSEAKIVITATDVTPEVGHRYVLRLIFPDIYEAPNQFAQPYEVIAKSTNPADLMTEFAKKINKNSGTRVTATVDAAIMTLTAKEKPYVDDDYELYSQVDVDAFMWKTIPSGILSNVAYAVANLTIAKTPATPGKGNPKIIRDRERAAFGYRGITHRANAVHPYFAPEVKADLSKTYDSLVVEWDNLYLSNDNQYIKTTPLAAEVYAVAGKISGSVFKTALEAFITKA